MHDNPGSNRECRFTAAVTRMIRVAIATLCLPVHGCDTGEGGAVELSWKLRPASSSLDEKFVDCNSRREGTGRVAEIELGWTVRTDEAAITGSKRWPCEDNRGATGFELPEGVAELSVAPICADGVPAARNTYIAPAIVRRDVIRGETVSLGAIELVVVVSNCGAPDRPCICTGTN